MYIKLSLERIPISPSGCIETSGRPLSQGSADPQSPPEQRCRCTGYTCDWGVQQVWERPKEVRVCCRCKQVVLSFISPPQAIAITMEPCPVVTLKTASHFHFTGGSSWCESSTEQLLNSGFVVQIRVGMDVDLP